MLLIIIIKKNKKNKKGTMLLFDPYCFILGIH